MKLVLALDVLIAMVILGLLISKHPKFRFVSSLALLGAWPTLLLLGVLLLLARVDPFPGMADALARDFFGWVIHCAVWVTYLQRSKRVRVTFEHRVLANKTLHTGTVIPKPQPPNEAAPSMSVAQPMRAVSLAHETVSPGTSSAVAGKSPSSNEDLWAQALAEFEGSSRRSGLWARSFSEAHGNEPIAKAGYLRERVAELEREHQEQVAEGVRQAKEQARQAEERDRQAKKRAKESALAHLSARAYAQLPKGLCPKCDAIILRSTEGCPKCGAIFDRDSALKVIPLGTDQQIDRLRSAYLAGKKPTADQVIFLVGASESQKSLLTLCDRFRGETLLHWCARFDLKGEATFLIANGANPSAPNGDGRRPFELSEDPELRYALRSAARL